MHVTPVALSSLGKQVIYKCHVAKVIWHVNGLQ